MSTRELCRPRLRESMLIKLLILPMQRVVASIQKYSEIFNLGMDEVVGVTKAPLDARFSEIRTKETNVGNFLCELMTRATGADI